MARAADLTTDTGPFNIMYPLYLFWCTINIWSKHLKSLNAAWSATRLAPSGLERAADFTTETGPFIIYPSYLFCLAINVRSK